MEPISLPATEVLDVCLLSIIEVDMPRGSVLNREVRNQGPKPHVLPASPFSSAVAYCTPRDGLCARASRYLMEPACRPDLRQTLPNHDNAMEGTRQRVYVPCPTAVHRYRVHDRSCGGLAGLAVFPSRHQRSPLEPGEDHKRGLMGRTVVPHSCLVLLLDWANSLVEKER